MSIHKLCYSAESLQKDKIENLEKELESQTKLINIKLNDMQSTINGMTDNLQNVQEINFDDGETKVVVNAKLFLDINKIIEDLKINLKYLEQDVKNKIFRKEKRNNFGCCQVSGRTTNHFRNHFQRNLISELEKCKNETVKDTIQLL